MIAWHCDHDGCTTWVDPRMSNSGFVEVRLDDAVMHFCSRDHAAMGLASSAEPVMEIDWRP
jgi:hypothetical protein